PSEAYSWSSSGLTLTCRIFSQSHFAFWDIPAGESFRAKSRNPVNQFTGKFTGYLGCPRHDSSFVKWLLTFCATAKLPWLSRPDDGKQSVSFSAVVLLVS